MKKFLILFIITFIQTEIAFAEKIPDMEGSIWVIKTHRKETVTFLPNGNFFNNWMLIISYYYIGLYLFEYNNLSRE